MAPTLTQLTGSTCVMKLNSIELRANPLTDFDYAELNEYIQDEIIKLARRNNIRMNDALKAAVGVLWNSEEGLRVITSKIGTFRIGYQMIKRNHNITFEDFVKFANEKPDKSLEEIGLVYTRLNTEQEVSEKNV